MVIILENEGHEVVFTFGDHNVLVKEQLNAEEHSNEMIMNVPEADAYIGKLIRLGYQRGN